MDYWCPELDALGLSSGLFPCLVAQEAECVEVRLDFARILVFSRWMTAGRGLMEPVRHGTLGGS